MLCLIQKPGNKSHLFGKENGKKKKKRLERSILDSAMPTALVPQSLCLSVRYVPTIICQMFPTQVGQMCMSWIPSKHWLVSS